MAEKRAFRYIYSNPTTPRGEAFIKEARDANDAIRQALRVQPAGTSITEVFKCPDHITVTIG